MSFLFSGSFVHTVQTASLGKRISKGYKRCVELYFGGEGREGGEEEGAFLLDLKKQFLVSCV